MTKVKKALIPAAGLGTRFLPATKTVPKEMLPIVDTPIIYYVIEECVRAGIEDVVLIAGRGKTAIEDFFDHSYELEDRLAKDNKNHFLQKVYDLRSKVNVISIRQKVALGLGHAVLAGAPIIGKEPFAVLLGDEIMISSPEEKTVTQQLTDIYNETNLSTVAVMEVAASEVSKYGIIGVENNQQKPYKVTHVVEKPKADKAPSRLALPGRYVFDAKIFEYLRNTKPGVGGEIQLTDGMTDLAKNPGLLATTFTGKRYDAGDKLGYLQANIELALKSPELKDSLQKYLKELASKL